MANVVESLENNLLPRVFQHTITSLLKNNRIFKPDFLKHIRSLYLTADEAKDQALQQLSDKELAASETDCHKGCYHCCGKVVEPTMPELYIILDYIRSNYSQSELDELMQNLERHRKRADASNSVSERVKAYCGFLQNKSCTIQDVKPLSCRGYASTDVEKCKQFVENPAIEIPLSICHYSPFHTTRKAIMKSLYIAGFTDVTEELNSGVLRLLKADKEKV